MYVYDVYQSPAVLDDDVSGDAASEEEREEPAADEDLSVVNYRDRKSVV